jgi:hypothetical protein
MIILGNAILILPDPAQPKPKQTEYQNGLPSEFRPDPENISPPIWGTIVDHGPACEIVMKGNRILFRRRLASVIYIDGIEHLLISESKLLYIE